jgi:hypothetical protein
VIKLVQELSAHGLITATHVNNPAKGNCTNCYRFLWHPWMQTAEDGDFRMVVREEQAPFPTAKSDSSSTPASEQEFTSPSAAYQMKQPRLTLAAHLFVMAVRTFSVAALCVTVH